MLLLIVSESPRMVNNIKLHWLPDNFNVWVHPRVLESRVILDSQFYCKKAGEDTSATNVKHIYLKQTFSDKKTFYALLKRIDSYRTTDAHARAISSKHENCLRWIRSRRFTSVSVVVVERGSYSFIYLHRFVNLLACDGRRARYATSPATPHTPRTVKVTDLIRLLALFV